VSDLTDKVIRCYELPYLLDTAEKVEWANRYVRDGHFWRLGDSCHHRPADLENAPNEKYEKAGAA